MDGRRSARSPSVLAVLAEFAVGLAGIAGSIWGFVRMQTVDRLAELPVAALPALVLAFGALLAKAFLFGGVPKWDWTPRGVLWAVASACAFFLLLFRIPVSVLRVLAS